MDSRLTNLFAGWHSTRFRSHIPSFIHALVYKCFGSDVIPVLLCPVAFASKRKYPNLNLLPSLWLLTAPHETSVYQGYEGPGEHGKEKVFAFFHLSLP